MNCPIHLGEIPLETERAAALPCGHVFCLSCITTCFDVKRAHSGPCPICKKKTTKAQIVPLFLEPNSPSSSPVKSQDAGQTYVRALLQRLQRLQKLDSNGSVDSDDEISVCAETDRFAAGMEGTSDIASKCVTEEVKAAAIHLQNLILPELQELRTVRAEARDLREENDYLKSTVHLKGTEIDNLNRRRISAERDLANLQTAKRITDHKASCLRETLSVKSEKLVDAENTIREKEELIQKMDADVKQYKRWSSDHKIMTGIYKARIQELELRLVEHEHMADSAAQGECSSRRSVAGSEASVPSKIRGQEDQDHTESLQPMPKRRRTEEKLTLTDMKLDKSCFVTKPPPSFKIPVKKRPEKRAASFLGLNITNGGQVKGPVVLGSRQRMGKRG